MLNSGRQRCWRWRLTPRLPDLVVFVSRPYGKAGAARKVRILYGGRVSFDYVLTTPACPLKGMMELEAKEAVKRVAGVTDVAIKMTASVKKDPRLESVMPPGVKNIIAVGSGHHIHIEKPELVIKSIREVVMAARKG